MWDGDIDKGFRVFERVLSENGGDAFATVGQLKDSFVVALVAFIGPAIRRGEREKRLAVVRGIAEDLLAFAGGIEETTEAIINKESDGYDYFTAVELVAEKLGTDAETVEKTFSVSSVKESLRLLR